MAKLILFHNSQEDIVIDKIDKLDYITTVNGQFKSAVDLSSPVITLSLNVKDVSRVNYIYIEDFDRFYFVDNVITYSDVFEFYLSVDVLTTFRGDIYRTDCVIVRNNFLNNNGDEYIVDNKALFFEDYDMNDTKLATGFFNPTIFEYGDDFRGCYVLQGYRVRREPENEEE